MTTFVFRALKSVYINYKSRIFDYVNEQPTLIQYIVHYATKCYKWLKSNTVQKQGAEQELLFLSTAETTASLKIQPQEIEEAKKELRALSTQKPNDIFLKEEATYVIEYVG